jgi:hypothetical protein
MLPLPSNALERFSAKGFGLITGHFPWIKSGGDLCVDSRNGNDCLSNLRFCDMVSAERFRVKLRKRLTAVSEEFDECMKFFWVRVFEGIARLTLAHLPVMGQPLRIPSRFSSTVALTKSVRGCTKLTTLCTQTR